MPIGSVVLFTGSQPPAGWLLCDGGEVSRSEFAALYEIIGDSYGNGDGSTTFNLPDLRGRFPIGAGDGPGLSSRVLGASGGEETHQLTVSELPSHTHPIPDVGFVPGASFAGTLPSISFLDPIVTGSTGEDVPHNNMPPFVSLNYIVRVEE